MPYLNIKISGDESVDVATKVANSFLENTTNILGKKPEVTSINIEFMKPTFWFIGSNSIEQKKCSTFYCDIKITEGTNTKVQKETYVKQCFNDMQSILGELEPASYIVIDDIKGDSWGFEGVTQEYRFIQSRN